MNTFESQPLIHRPRLRAEWQARHRELVEYPERAKIMHRFQIHLIHDYLKEAHVGQFTFRSDEDPPMGGGEAPRPLQYYVAAAGF